MEGELLTEDSSTPSASSSESSAHKKKGTDMTYTEVFHQHCPFYLNAGMTYHDFWEGDAEMVKDFRFAYQLRIKDQNYTAWLQGLYIYNALAAVIPAMSIKSKATKIDPYISEPIPITKYEVREAERKKMEENIAFLKSFANRYNSKNKDKKGG